MNEMLNQNQQLQARSVDLREKIALAEKAIEWFEANPGGTVEDARRQKEACNEEFQKIEAERSGLLQRLLSTSFDGD
jgi:hypothetical protein